jgi:hypothetical protein
MSTNHKNHINESQGIQSTYTDSLYSMNLQHLIKHRHVATLFSSTHALRQISEAIRIYIFCNTKCTHKYNYVKPFEKQMYIKCDNI